MCYFHPRCGHPCLGAPWHLCSLWQTKATPQPQLSKIPVWLSTEGNNLPIITFKSFLSFTIRNVIKIVLPFRRLKRIEAPKMDRVPVPVRSLLTFPFWIMFRIKLRYWCSSCYKQLKMWLIKNIKHLTYIDYTSGIISEVDGIFAQDVTFR